jgi:hypothetical protein
MELTNEEKKKSEKLEIVCAKTCKNCYYYLSDYENCQGQEEICFEFKNKLEENKDER